MRVLEEKSWFLHLAYQTLAKGATDRGRLQAAKAEVQRLCKELEVSLRSREDLSR
jgi:hypothetical protein